MKNRYNELSTEQQLAISKLINMLASYRVDSVTAQDILNQIEDIISS